MSVYMFVDGAYLERAYERLMSVFRVPGDLDIRALASRTSHLYRVDRTFYYHAIDVNKQGNETEEQTAARVAAIEARLDRINGYENVHVREGTVSSRKKRQRRQQKQVDVLLAVDMLTHSFSKNVSRAILIAGDIDFLPVVDAVANLGVIVEVWFEKTSASKELCRRADRAWPISVEDALKWTTDAGRGEFVYVPDRRINVSADRGVTMTQGECGQVSAELFEQHDRWNLTLHSNPDRTYCHRDRDVLLRFVEYEQGEPIVWK